MVVYAANIADTFTTLLGNVVDVVVKVVIFLAIMGLGWLVATWLHRWLTRLLRRVGFDRAVERGGLGRLMGANSASDLTARLIVLGFLLFVLQLAFGIFGPNPVSDLIRAVVAWIPLLFVAVVIIVVAAAISGWVRDLITGALGGLSYGRAVATAAQVLILALGVIAALNQIGVATSVTMPILIAVLATIAGVIVVGVGGGLIRPMQHRWERILNRAETESTLAAEKVRAHRAQQTADRNSTDRNSTDRDSSDRDSSDRDANESGGFDQPAYGGRPATPDDAKPTERRSAENPDPSAKPSDPRSPNTKPDPRPETEPDDQTPDHQTPDHQMPDGRTSEGQTSGGQTPGDQSRSASATRKGVRDEAPGADNP